MRRLDIVLTGRSQALNELAMELERHGHLLRRLDSPQAIANAEGLRPHLLIDDGSLGDSPILAADTVRLELRIALIAQAASALPQVCLFHRHGARLIEQATLPSEASGNGQALRSGAIARLVASTARLVSGFSRGAAFFHQLAPWMSPAIRCWAWSAWTRWPSSTGTTNSRHRPCCGRCRCRSPSASTRACWPSPSARP
ncbi:hypothetical protein TRE132_01370 [Pseudomonas chlororaphis subsp. aurantiaca]|nr:hypothetical protein TRE132_01370 [Pseudomonas chlororaphis subsp. aurantiaca]